MYPWISCTLDFGLQFCEKKVRLIHGRLRYFKLAKTVLKMGSFEFINLQYVDSTFMNINIARLVLNAKCKIVLLTQCSCQSLLCD